MADREKKKLSNTFTPQFVAPPSRASPWERASGRHSQQHDSALSSAASGSDRDPSRGPPLQNLPASTHISAKSQRASVPSSAREQPRTLPMSQRNRSGRGLNRNNGGSHGEEVALWDTLKDKLPEVLAKLNEDGRNLEELLKLDAEANTYRKKGKEPPPSLLAKMEAHCRKGVKTTEAMKLEIPAYIEKINILRAILQANKDQGGGDSGSGPAATGRSAASSRPTRDRERDRENRDREREKERDPAATSSLYDFDGSGESPVRSPMGGSTRRFGTDRSSNRDSIPPQSDSAETGSAAGSGSVGGSGGTSAAAAAAAAAAAQAKTKVVFAKGDEVAFRPKQGNGGEHPDWILGEVAAVIGDGKTRRYKVMDVEPDESSKQREYRTSASNMIPITPESQAATLLPWEAGKMVLALYPQTTTFYKAEVMGTSADGKVNLHFEGESDSATLQQVERRFVVEFR
ncbi:hypothetical protein jhhlp_007645 [Lomentospora prolificans]|uniref:SGF29 C-terminal domain-containing protein n=1 Tax=Lomentospora prolificans TaxID=41688 RepID=A0A2N3N060_9PEZI|nr:hypothetical protein jhhlp_007645 [Lomentospora prolificans]